MLLAIVDDRAVAAPFRIGAGTEVTATEPGDLPVAESTFASSGSARRRARWRGRPVSCLVAVMGRWASG